MKTILLLAIATTLSGCASTKQFLRPMNYSGVEKAKTLMEAEGYVPVKGSNRELFIVKGQDARLYSSELQEFALTQSIARTAQLNGEPYTLPVVPSTFGYGTITAEDWFASNRAGENTLANVVDTLWNGVLVGGTLYAGQELTDAFGSDDDGNSSDTTITAGGNVNVITDSNIGGNVGSAPETVTVEGVEE
jgi:hypothetical protein